MQARSSLNSVSYNNRPSPLQLLLKPRSPVARSASPPTPSSPLAHSSSTYSSRESNERRASHHKSLCELIPEELNLGSDLSATLHNHLDLSSEPYKRHHKPRSPLIRSQTEPYYLSTTTTKPVHIPSSKYAYLFSSIIF
jgi:UTP--glucose-1-phosphate uridylyltransferase